MSAADEPRIVLVVAMARNRAIGIDGDLPWRLPGDLAYFKRVTMGKPLVMGRKTWESLPRKPLPGRPNIIVTRAAGYVAEGAEVFDTVEGALARAKELAVDVGEVCVVGGAEIYRQTLPHADRLYLTEIEAAPKADTYFPEIDPGDWHETAREPGPPPKDPAMEAPEYHFVTLDRRKGVRIG